MVWSTAFCVLAAVVLFLFADPIVSLFGNDAAMISLAAKALKLNAVLLVTFGLQMVYASLYLAIGKSLIGSLLSLSRQGIFFFPMIVVLPFLFGLTGLISVQPLADLFTAILTGIFAVKIQRELTNERG